MAYVIIMIQLLLPTHMAVATAVAMDIILIPKSHHLLYSQQGWQSMSQQLR